MGTRRHELVLSRSRRPLRRTRDAGNLAELLTAHHTKLGHRDTEPQRRGTDSTASNRSTLTYAWPADERSSLCLCGNRGQRDGEPRGCPPHVSRGCPGLASSAAASCRSAV